MGIVTEMTYLVILKRKLPTNKIIISSTKTVDKYALSINEIIKWGSRTYFPENEKM